jgi:hypothetical protein
MGKAVVRVPQDNDIVALTAIYNYYVSATPSTFDLEAFTVEERRKGWFDHYSTSGRHRLLVLENEDEVIGYSCSSTFRPKVWSRGRGNECSELVTTPLATGLRHSESELGTLVTTTPMGCAVSEAIAQTAALRKAGGAGGRALDRLTSTFKG